MTNWERAGWGLAESQRRQKDEAEAQYAALRLAAQEAVQALEEVEYKVTHWDWSPYDGPAERTGWTRHQWIADLLSPALAALRRQLGQEG